MIWAAFQGDLAQVQDLLEKVTDINAFDEVCYVKYTPKYMASLCF